MANRLRRALDLSDFVTVPLAIGAVLLVTSPFGRVSILYFAGGFVAWTLVEYGIHRALHAMCLPVFTRTHAVLRRAHIRHHQHPTDLPGGTAWSTTIILALSWSAFLWPIMAPFVGGFLAGYLAFIVLHHGEHHGWDLTAAGDLAAHHDRHHHARPRGCFGVTTRFWDRLFGTL